MTINNPEEYVKSIWDWGILKGCFYKDSSLMDIDGLYCWQSHMLMIETKGIGVIVPKPQIIALKEFSKKPKCSSLIIWGEVNNPHEWIWIHAGHGGHKKAGSIKELRTELKSWFDVANKGWWNNNGMVH